MAETLARGALEQAGRQPDGDIDIADTALALAALGRRKTARHPYHRHLDKLAEQVTDQARRRAGSEKVNRRAAALATVLGQRYGYCGADDAYEDPHATNLMDVIDRRRGVAVALTILYLAVARRLGWAAEGIGFPIRTLARLEHKGERVLLDPFDEGRLVSVPDLRALYKAGAGAEVELAPGDYRVLSNRELLGRLGNRIRARQLREKDLKGALETVQNLRIIDPENPELVRETGFLKARLDDLPGAIVALEGFLAHGPQRGELHDRTKEFLAEVRDLLNSRTRSDISRISDT